jgi:multisubunit Na+/H+ antiporter MnhF subunit
VNAFTIAATALLVGLLPLAFVCLRASELDAVVAVELAGAVASLVLLCLAEGFHRSTYVDVAVACAALSWVGGMVFVRFLARGDAENE